MNLRATGLVTSTDRRTGTSKASGNPYDNTDVTLLTADGQVSFSGPTLDLSALTVGSYVDVAVEVSSWNGAIQTRYRSLYNEQKLSNLVESLVSSYSN